MGKSVAQGAATHVYLAAFPEELQGREGHPPVSGKYFVDTHPEPWGHPAVAKDPKLGKNLWGVSEKLTGQHMEPAVKEEVKETQPITHSRRGIWY